MDHDMHTHKNCTCGCIEGIKVSTHKNSIIGSFEKTIAKINGNEFSIIEQSINELGLSIKANGGMYGHIKAFIEGNGYATTLSLAGKEINIIKRKIKSDISSLKIDFVAIAFGISEEFMFKKLHDIFHIIM